MRSVATLSPGLGALFQKTGLERRLALLLTVCAIVAGLATYAVTSWGAPGEGGARTLIILLNVDLILLLLLGIVIARRLVTLAMERRQGRAGSRLHVRLVALFGFLAATPAIVVAIFSVVFLSSGLEYWFSARVSAALENSLSVAEAYLAEHREVIRADALAMASDLEREGPQLFDSPDYLRHVVVGQAALRSLTEAILFDGSGRVLAHSGLGIALEVEQLPAELVTRAERGEVVTVTNAAEDRVRAVLRLNMPGQLYLFVGRFVDPQVLGYMERTRQVVSDYRQLQTERVGIQVTSALIFVIVALLLLLAAIWVGINLADRLARPIVRLINASERIGRGDLTARVPAPAGADDEVALLSRAFNRMTDQLESQRQALVTANEQLDFRRQFTEAVLSGVTAGVIGLDAGRRIALPNRFAIDMLAAGGQGLEGRPIDEILPEIAHLFGRLPTTVDGTVQEEVAIERGGRKRILLVRVVAQVGVGRVLGYVVTFDDVTDLVSAQRQAAWSEVARRIAHEIKNPLTPIRLSAERLSRRFLQQIDPGDRDSFGRSVSTIVRQVDVIGRLVGEFSAFARMPRPSIRFEPLGEILRGSLNMEQVAWPTVEFRLDLPEDDALMVACDAEQVGRALTNLLQNAAHALVENEQGPAAGPLQVEVVARRIEGAVLIEVRDNGPGFPAETRERLFEPYFTTRAQGTGLGLAIVKKIMEEHQGRVDLDRSPGGGAVVRLWFPVWVAEAAADGSPARSSDAGAERSAAYPVVGAG